MSGRSRPTGHTAAAGAAPRSARPTVTALAGVAVPPMAWFLHLNVSYLLVPAACGAGQRWPFGAVTVLALAAMVPTARGSWRRWRDEQSDDLVRILGAAGAAFAALFALGVVLVGASALIVEPCR